MSSPFRSLAGLASRRRARPVVERSTFVVIGLGGERLALPVELVERVLRTPAEPREVQVGGQCLPLTDLSAALGLARGPVDQARSRVLILRDRQRCWAVVVDAVFDVCAVETATIRPWSADVSGPHREARIATFERLGQTIVVIDALRLLPESLS